MFEILFQFIWVGKLNQIAGKKLIWDLAISVTWHTLEQPVWMPAKSQSVISWHALSLMERVARKPVYRQDPPMGENRFYRYRPGFNTGLFCPG
jgi:hypothetical protein